MVLFLSEETVGTTPPDTAFYGTTKKEGNIGGLHCFDGVVADYFTDLYDLVNDGEDSDGERVRWVDKVSQATVLSFLIHKNGRQGPRDLELDTVVMDVNEVSTLPEDVQTLIYGAEQVPGGRRS